MSWLSAVRCAADVAREPSDRVRAISVAMGLTPVLWTRISPLATFDTDGKAALSLHSKLH